MLSVYANFDSFGPSIKCTFRMAAMHFAIQNSETVNKKLICIGGAFH